jgi:hypothetical protein
LKRYLPKWLPMKPPPPVMRILSVFVTLSC